MSLIAAFHAELFENTVNKDDDVRVFGGAWTGEAPWMMLALGLADRAAAMGEVPVAAVAIAGGAAAGASERCVGRGVNLRETLRDPTAHAELIALREAAQTLGRWRLDDVTLYVTVEPCAMCAAAIGQARVRRLVYAAVEPKTGACESRMRLLDGSATQVVRDADMSARAEAQMQAFFAALRADKGAVVASDGEVAELVEGA